MDQDLDLESIDVLKDRIPLSHIRISDACLNCSQNSGSIKLSEVSRDTSLNFLQNSGNNKLYEVNRDGDHAASIEMYSLFGGDEMQVKSKTVSKQDPSFGFYLVVGIPLILMKVLSHIMERLLTSFCYQYCLHKLMRL